MQKTRFFTVLSVEEVIKRQKENEALVYSLRKNIEDYNRRVHPEKFSDTQPTVFDEEIMQKSRFFTVLTVEEVIRRQKEHEEIVRSSRKDIEDYNRRVHPERFSDAQPPVSTGSVANK